MLRFMKGERNIREACAVPRRGRSADAPLPLKRASAIGPRTISAFCTKDAGRHSVGVGSSRFFRRCVSRGEDAITPGGHKYRAIFQKWEDNQ